MKCNEDVPEKEEDITSGFETDDPEFAEFQKVLESGQIDPEMMKEMMKQQKEMGIQPPKFQQVSGGVKHDLEEDTWNGFKLNLGFRPSQMFNNEFEYNIDDIKFKGNKWKLASHAIKADKSNPESGTILVGRMVGSEEKSMMYQLHHNLTSQDKLLAIANFQKPDYNQGQYEFEYERKFDRLMTGIKYNSQGIISLNAVTTVNKGTFFGVEAMISGRTPISYSYVAKFKPMKNMTTAASYISYAQMGSIDSIISFNKLWKMYLSASKCWNPQAAMMGGNNNWQFSMTHLYKYNTEADLAFEIFNSGVRTHIDYKLNKSLGLCANMELGWPSFGKGSKKKKIIQKFGIGLKIEGMDFQDMFSSPTEDDGDLSDYAIDA